MIQLMNVFFDFEGKPWFPGVSLNLRDGVKETYNPKVVDSVVDAADRNLDECITLANLVMPEIQALGDNDVIIISVTISKLNFLLKIK